MESTVIPAEEKLGTINSGFLERSLKAAGDAVNGEEENENEVRADVYEGCTGILRLLWEAGDLCLVFNIDKQLLHVTNGFEGDEQRLRV